MSQIERFLAIDERGFLPLTQNSRYDSHWAQSILKNMQRDERGRFLSQDEEGPFWVEAFDEPLVAEEVSKLPDGQWLAHFPYEFLCPFSLESLSLDEWDRFHGHVPSAVPFVFSRTAQSQFFDLLDAFDDDSITVDQRRYFIPSWLPQSVPQQPDDIWNNRYLIGDTPWSLNHPAPALVDGLAQLKIPKQRVLVLGCGTGTDASYLAQLGHLVTAVDISAKAIQIARENHSRVKNLQFLQADIFHLPSSFHHSFDLVFEHTCYCAIPPSQRDSLVKIWKQALVNDGHLFGIFFTMDRRQTPPFGGSEWEIRQRLKGQFDFLYWTRWRKSVPDRQGAELLVYARRRGDSIG